MAKKKEGVLSKIAQGARAAVILPAALYVMAHDSPYSDPRRKYPTDEDEIEARYRYHEQQRDFYADRRRYRDDTEKKGDYIFQMLVTLIVTYFLHTADEEN